MTFRPAVSVRWPGDAAGAAGGARLVVAPPSLDLAGVVEACVVVARPAAGSVSRFPAMPRAMLVAARAGDGTPVVHFTAPGTRPAVHRHAGPITAQGLVLPLVTAARLMGPGTGALVDATVPWAAVAGDAEAARLDDALQAAGDHEACLAALQDSLRRVLCRGPARVSEARAAMLRELAHEVGALGARATGPLGLGERQPSAGAGRCSA